MNDRSHSGDRARGALQRPRAPVWMKLALALSLAVNLGIAGVIGGVALRRATDPAPPVSMWRDLGPQELGLRAALAALEPVDRRALRGQWRAAIGAGETPPARMQRSGAVAQNPGAAVLAMLRSDTFDPAVLQDALELPQQRLARVARDGSTLLVARISAMSADERRAYADRLETILAQTAGQKRVRSR